MDLRNTSSSESSNISSYGTLVKENLFSIQSSIVVHGNTSLMVEEHNITFIEGLKNAFPNKSRELNG